MSLNAALLFLSVAAAFEFISAQSTCRSTVLCLCGSTPETSTSLKYNFHTFRVCAEQNTASADPCSTRWPGCRSCGGDSEDPACFAATNLIQISRRKRQYTSYGKEKRHSYPAKRVRWVRQSAGGCSEDVETPKLGSIRCTFGRGRKTCTGTCLPGYTFQGMHEEEMVLSCSEGHWTPSRSFPPCVSGGHCDLVVQGHGKFNCTTGMQGTRCDVFCSSRFAGRYNCYPGEPWEPTLPRCVRPKGGISDSHQHCHCEHGASCDNNGHCVCPAGRTGSHCESTVPVVTCPDPGQVAHADRLNTDGSPSRDAQSYKTGQSVVYTCHEGYALQRRSLITCQTSGSWSGSLPYCRSIQKPDIPSTTTARPEERGGGLVYCRDPGRVTNGNRIPVAASTQRGFPQDSSLEYSCNQGYTLKGVGSIICLASGRWSSVVPRCEKQQFAARPEEKGEGLVYCRDPGRVTNGNRIPVAASSQRGFPQDSSLEYSCNQGYTLKGVGSIICLASGRWSSVVPRCEKQQSAGDGEFCFNPGSIQNGKITYYPNQNIRVGSEVSLDEPYYPSNSRLVYSCNKGYRLQGAAERTCRGDVEQWSTEPPTCVQALSRIMMFCDNPGPIIYGRIRHIPPTTTAASISEDDIEYPEGTRLEYSCDDEFVLLGPSSLSCLSTSSWSSDPPICSAGCGYSSALSSIRIFNGTVTRAGEWPWVVSIKEDKDSEIICGGAVISSRTVVTAAHCLTGSGSYILYFGKIHKLDSDDDDQVVVRTSNRITIHPNFSDRTKDSDIGLIHFSNRIRFTDRIQPICLPDKITTAKNLRPTRKGYVAGFGEDERSVQPDNLMQARIPVQDNRVCVDYYEEQGLPLLMTRNMFCAGYAGGQQATCQGDSGSALVFFDPSTDRFTLEGLVSFATNGQCGLNGRYIIFTRVFPYVNWLLANLM